MILSDRTLVKMLKDGALKIAPLSDRQIQPASIDIRLGNTFSVIEDSAKGIITLEEKLCYKTIQTESYTLRRGSLF